MPASENPASEPTMSGEPTTPGGPTTPDEPTTASEPTTPDEPWTYTLSVPNDPRAVTICRRVLRLILTLHGLPHLLEAAELAATELVTNAIQHTKGPAAMKLHWSAPTLRITVQDTNPRLYASPPPSPTRESGRGLTLVKECADKWGWFTSIITDERAYENGKFVWCELAATP